jgi:hypothetical protein
LALESPLGGPRSNVYRAMHVKQRAQLAVRVFSVPLGMTPEAKTDFASQMEALKSLRHPGIVRCFGGGFDQKDAYLVYELAEGESLETMLSRRGQLPWESVLDYGQQISQALHHAHSQGWTHGRLRPDKLLVSPDASIIQITDFRRAVAASNFIEKPLSIEELAYVAPEALGGQIDVASDVYSLGAVLYQMLTGGRPFEANSATEMRMLIQTQRVTPVASLVFDCPVWLSAILEQCLAKEPAQRPYTAESLSMALTEAQRRATDGTGVVEHAVSGFSPLQLTSANRDEAEKVLGRKKKKAKRRVQSSGASFAEGPLFLVGCLIVVVALLTWFMLPLTESKLRARAETLLATEEPVDWNNARDRYLIRMVGGYPNGEHYDWAVEQLKLIAMKNAERRMERAARVGLKPKTEAERRYIEANRFEQFGDRVTALEKYRAIVNLFEDEGEVEPIVNLANRQVAAIEKDPPSIAELREFLTRKLEDADELYQEGDVLGAKVIWDSILSLYNGNQEMLPIVTKTQQRLEALKESDPGV